MDTTIGMVASSIAGAQPDTIGLLYPTTPLILAASTSALPTSVRRTTMTEATKVMVSQFAELQYLTVLANPKLKI